MSYSRAVAFQRMHDEFDRFPNIELVEQVKLGQIGFFNSRRKSFNWRTSLENLGIHPILEPTSNRAPIVDEIYTGDDAVDYQFSLNENNLGKANFKFRRRYSLATQAFDMTSHSFEIDPLQKSIIDAIREGEIKKWERDWVIVTQIFTSSSFSLLIAGGWNSEAEISTQVPISTIGFNIADPSLNLTLTRSKRIAYRALGKQNVTPFFRVHKFKGDWNSLEIRLEPYGRN